MFTDLEHMWLRRVEDILHELYYYELLDDISKDKHVLCAAQIQSFRYYCVNINQTYNCDDVKLNNLIVIILRIIKSTNIPLEIDFKILINKFQNSEKKFLPLKNTYYNELFCEGDIIADTQDEYVKEVDELNNRKVLIEKTWQSHIGTLNYWNKKFMTYA